MNAQEAREKAMSIGSGKVAKQYNDVKNRIYKAVENGEFNAHYYDPLLEGVKQKLELEGFKIVSYYDQRDGTNITISW